MGEEAATAGADEEEDDDEEVGDKWEEARMCGAWGVKGRKYDGQGRSRTQRFVSQQIHQKLQHKQ